MGERGKGAGRVRFKFGLGGDGFGMDIKTRTWEVRWNRLVLVCTKFEVSIKQVRDLSMWILHLHN